MRRRVDTFLQARALECSPRVLMRTSWLCNALGRGPAKPLRVRVSCSSGHPDPRGRARRIATERPARTLQFRRGFLTVSHSRAKAVCGELGPVRVFLSFEPLSHPRRSIGTGKLRHLKSYPAATFSRLAGWARPGPTLAPRPLLVVPHSAPALRAVVGVRSKAALDGGPGAKPRESVRVAHRP